MWWWPAGMVPIGPIVLAIGPIFSMIGAAILIPTSDPQ
jgi:hypothetical protein